MMVLQMPTERRSTSTSRKYSVAQNTVILVLSSLYLFMTVTVYALVKCIEHEDFLLECASQKLCPSFNETLSRCTVFM